MIKLEILKNRLSSRLRFNILVGLSVLVLLGFNIYDIASGKTNLGQLIFSCVVILFAAVILAFNIYFIQGSVKDLKGLKNGKYERIKATFVSFASRRLKNKNSREISYSGQVFKELETNKTYELDVYGVEHKETYDIAFGKHSKIGIAIKKVK